MSLKLHPTTGQGRNALIHDRKQAYLGRSPDTTSEIVAIHVEDPEVSRHHAKIYKDGNSWFIEDLGSTNGTFLNGRRLEPNTPMKLDEGAEIRVGKKSYQVRVDQTLVWNGERPQFPDSGIIRPTPVDLQHLSVDHPPRPQRPQRPQRVSRQADAPLYALIEVVGSLMGLLGVGWLLARHMVPGLVLFVVGLLTLAIGIGISIAIDSIWIIGGVWFLVVFGGGVSAILLWRHTQT